MKKKIVSMLLALSMVGGLLAGCGGNGNSGTTPATDNNGTNASAESQAQTDTANGDKEVLKFYHAFFHEESEWAPAAVMRDIYQDFADAHADGPVIFEAIPVEDTVALATNEIAGGTFPDVVDLAGNAVPLAAISQQMVIDLKPYIDAEGLQSKVGINYTMNDDNGAIYSVHDQLTTLGLWYNADIYAAANATTPDQWKNYEDMEKAMEALRTYGAAEGIYGYSAGQASTRLFNAYMGQLNADYAANALTEEAINSEEFATVFKTVAAMDQANGSAHSTTNAGDFSGDFSSGKCATWINGVWAASSFADTKFDVQPGLYPGSASLSAPGGGITISSNLSEAQQELALEFLKYMTSDEVQARIFLEVNAHPCNTDIDLNALAETSDDPTVKLLAQACSQANDAASITKNMNSAWGQDVWEAIMNKLIECSVEGTDIDAKLAELQSELIGLIG
ncbi:MAG: ABC transporter substrate-binding protein [Lachnospiraceae bacterium]